MLLGSTRSCYTAYILWTIEENGGSCGGLILSIKRDEYDHDIVAVVYYKKLTIYLLSISISNSWKFVGNAVYLPIS